MKSPVQLITHNQIKQLSWNNTTYYIDFLSSQQRLRCRQASRSNERLARAVGIKAGYRPTVLDLTAGLANDALILATLGCHVTLIERHPLLAELLEQAIHLAQQDTEMGPIVARLQLIKTDSLPFLQQHLYPQPPDVIYLDPMFPPRKKSALVKKRMQMLHALITDNSEQETSQLLEAALNCHEVKRVVIKRPPLTPAVQDFPPPAFTFEGRLCRFDIYIPSAITQPLSRIIDKYTHHNN